MMREVPVRDTDPDPLTNTMNNNQEEDRSSPVAFTVDFGKTKGSGEEKSRKLERFVHKSSQRRAGSPLLSPACHERVRGQEANTYRLQHLPSHKELVRRQNRRGLHSLSQERRKDRDDEVDDCDDYTNDKFESESDKSPSETGTYTVDKDDQTTSPPSLQEPRLSSLSSNKTSYVEEWATKHAFPVSSPPECFVNTSRSPDGTKSSLNSNKSRRLLPATPQSDSRPGDSLQFSPSSEPSCSLTPPNLQESEDESSYVSHTQHLVEVMEERIKQKNLKKFEVKSTRSLVSGKVTGKKESKSVTGKKLTKSVGKNTIKSPEPHQEAMEAWKRRKNYNPMAAAGRKRVSEARKQSVGQEDTSEGESVTRQSRQIRSAPASGKTRGPTNSSSTPLRRLAQTNSSSSLQGKSNRSSSSLTSKEAEFQAWKRRKDYDPRKAAARPSSSRKVSSASSNTSNTTVRRQKKLSELSSSAMTKSLIIEELSPEAPMQRSNSFQSNAKLKKNGRQHSEDESEEDYGSGYDSSLAESQLRSYPHRHYYLDDDELILPLQSSQSNISQRSLYNRSPHVSPNKSRSKLEALDSLVISTIHNVSNKLCSSSAAVLRQAALVFPEQDEDKASTLETVIYLLEDLDLPPSPAKKTSRELSGTLRNLKKIEQSMEMMKKLLQPDDEEDE